MDDIEDNGRYSPNPYGMNQGYESSNRQKLPVPDTFDNQYVEEADDDEDVDDEVEQEEEDDDDDDDDNENGVQRIGKDVFEDDGDDDDDDNDNDYGDSQRHQKKRKLKSLLSSYEFAPRVPPPPPPPPPTAPKPSFGGRNPLSDWSEHETFILLDAWGTRFVRHGRKSLRSEEWQEVAQRVSQGSKIERTDTQCRNRLDTLKKKYKKEKMKFAAEGEIGSSSTTSSKWVYFKKMDMLLTSSTTTTPQQGGISCGGVDSGEYVFMSPKVYPNRANGLDEMRDSPANSESADSEDLPPKRSRNGRSGRSGNSFKLIADSIHKFSEIYVKIENSKREQMLELEKMRMDFHRELELQKRQIVERAHAEIARIRQGNDEENDISAENGSG